VSDLLLPAELEICESWIQFQYAWLSRLDLEALLVLGASLDVIFNIPQTRVTAVEDIISSRWGDHLQYDIGHFQQMVAHFERLATLPVAGTPIPFPPGSILSVSDTWPLQRSPMERGFLWWLACMVLPRCSWMYCSAVVIYRPLAQD
jgi:hypothetical protein